MGWLSMILGAIIILPHIIASIYNENREYYEMKITWEPWAISFGVILVILAGAIVWR